MTGTTSGSFDWGSLVTTLGTVASNIWGNPQNTTYYSPNTGFQPNQMSMAQNDSNMLKYGLLGVGVLVLLKVFKVF